MPDSFLSGCISPIVKRGRDPGACSNYRLNTMSCFVSKVFEYVLLPAINSKCNFTSFQLGFRKGMGCVQAHHIVGRLMKQSISQKSPLYCLTVDISSAFDNVTHSYALFSLASLGVNLSIVSVLKYWYAIFSVRVKWNGTVGEYIPVKKGVRQGAVLSPSIFKCVLASCLQWLQPSIFYNDNLGISHVAYADDVLLPSRTKHSLITNLYRLSAALSTVGLSVNASKCEFLCFGSPPSASPLCLGSSTIPCSASMKR